MHATTEALDAIPPSICLHTESETGLQKCLPSHHFHTVKNTPEGIFTLLIAAPKITSAAINHDIDSENFTCPLEV